MSGPKFATEAEPVKVTLEQVPQSEAGPAKLTGRTTQPSALGRYLGNRRFSSLLTSAAQCEFEIAFAETSKPAPSMEVIKGLAALGTRAEVQLLWGPYSGERFWPLGAGEATKSWLPSIARMSSFNERKGTGPTSGNDLLVCKVDPAGEVQVFKAILNEQKAVANREFLKTTAISSSLVKNVSHNIGLLERRAAAPGIATEEREILAKTIQALKATEAALSDPTGKTPLPAEIGFELTNLGGAGDRFGIGNTESHLRILAKTFAGEEGRLLGDIIDHTFVRDRALASRLRAANVALPETADPDVVPMRLLLTPQASEWLALKSGLTPEHWLKQQKQAAGEVAYAAEYAKLEAEELSALREKSPELHGPALTKKQSKAIEAKAKKVRAPAKEAFEAKLEQAWQSTKSVSDRPAVAQLPVAADSVSPEKTESAGRWAREAAAAKDSSSRTYDAHLLRLLETQRETAARLVEADAKAAESGSFADVANARKIRAELVQGARQLNEMGEVSRLLLESQTVAEKPAPGPSTVVVAETPAKRVASARSAPSAVESVTPPRAAESAFPTVPSPSQGRTTARVGQASGPVAQYGPSPMGETVGGVGQLLVDIEVALGHEAAYRNARKSQSLRTLHWWLLKGVIPQASGVTDRWSHFEMGLTEPEWVSVEDERESDVRKIVEGANEGRFDGIEIDAPNQAEQYEAFERWVRGNVHTLEDFYLHFYHDMDPGVRWNPEHDTFEVVSWEWGDIPPANVSDTWTVDQRIDKFMHEIKATVMAQTRDQVGRRSVGERLGESGAFRIAGIRRFKDERFLDRGYQYPDTGFRPLEHWGFNPVFYEIEHEAVPPGFALVSGADLRTYLFILDMRARYGLPADTGPVLSIGAPDRLLLPTLLPVTGWKDLTLPVVLVNKESLE